MARDKWTPETPWFGGNKKTLKVWPTYTCRNPNCKSYGKSHPNCHCGIPSFAQQSKNLEYDAVGGQVGAHFCQSRETHHPSCEHFADGGEVATHLEFASNPDLSLDHSIVAHGLLHALTKTGHSRSENPAKVMEDHLASVKRGKKELETRSKNIFETGKDHQIKSDKDHVAALRAHLDEIRQNPHQLLNIGGSLGALLPDHAGILGAKAATAVNYLDAIRPKSQQLNPMSEPIPPTKGEEARYTRQLEIAQNPTMVYQHIKDGRLQPDDLHTVQSIYPKLLEQMKNQTTGAVIDSKTEGKQPSYKHRMGLGSLLGQPLDYTQSPAAMQAIIQANSNQEPAQQGKQKRGPTAQTQKTIEKSDQLAETPIDQSLIDQKTRM